MSAAQKPAGGPVQKSLVGRVLKSRETGILTALLIMFVGLSFFAPDFASVNNLLNDARNFSFVGIVVLGQAMVMITGGIDLSVGSVWGLTAVTSAAFMNGGMGPIPACILALLIAAAVGLFNGLCVTKLRMPALRADARHHEHRAGAGAGHHARPFDRRLPPL